MKAWLIFNACSPACRPVEAVMYDAFLAFTGFFYVLMPTVIVIVGPIYWAIRKVRGEA